MASTRAARAAQCMQSIAGPSNYWMRSASTSTVKRTMTNQQERAIRLRSMAKRQGQDSDTPMPTPPSSSASKPPSRSRARERQFEAHRHLRHSDREDVFLLSQDLFKLKRQVLRFDDDRKGMSPLDAYSKASALIEEVASKVTMHTIIYNQIIDLAARAGKGQLVMDLWTDMKKRGVWPNVATFTTIFSGFYRNDIDPRKATSLVRRLDAIFAEFDSLREEALGGMPTPATPIAQRHRRRAKGSEEQAENGEDNDEERSDNRIGYRRALIRKLREHPTDINAVLATYIRLMVKIDRPEAAWSILDRMSRSWDINSDGYPRMTKQVAGAWMNAIATTHSKLLTGDKELPPVEAERVVTLWTRWREMIMGHADEVAEKYTTAFSKQQKEAIVAEWRLAIPSSRQIVDVMELAAKSRSPRLCDVAMQALIDFTNLPLPESMEARRRLPQGPQSPQLRDPEHPLYMLCNFPVESPQADIDRNKGRTDQERARRAKTSQWREEPEVWDHEAGWLAETQKLFTGSTNFEWSNINLGWLLIHLQKAMHHSTMPDAEQVVYTILSSAAESSLAALPASVREKAAATPLGYGGLYNRINRRLLDRTCLTSHAAWGAALHGVSLLPSPLSVVRSTRSTLVTMRRLYQCGLTPTPPDELHYKRAMMAVSRQARYVGGQETLANQGQIGQWWLEDRLEAAKTTSVDARHGWMPWAETNGALFADAVRRVHAIVAGAERRAAALNKHDRARRDTRKQDDVSRRLSSDEIIRSEGGEPRPRIETLFSSPSCSLSSPLPPGNEAKTLVVNALKLWRSSLTQKPEDAYNPYPYLDEVPFPKASMLADPAPAEANYRSTTMSISQAGAEARGAGEKERKPRFVMPDVQVWTKMARDFDALLRIALDTGSQGVQVLPREEVEWLKEMKVRVREFMDAVEEAQGVKKSEEEVQEEKAFIRRQRRAGVPLVRDQDRERRVRKEGRRRSQSKTLAPAWRKAQGSMKEGQARETRR